MTADHDTETTREGKRIRKNYLPRSESFSPARTSTSCPQRSILMKRTLVRYKTKPEMTQENERLIKSVFQELQMQSPAGVRYMVLKLPDGSFVHFAQGDTGTEALTTLPAFRAFQ